MFLFLTHGAINNIITGQLLNIFGLTKKKKCIIFYSVNTVIVSIVCEIIDVLFNEESIHRQLVIELQHSLLCFS